MKKVFKRIFAASLVMMTALSVGVFAGCKYGANQEELKKKEGYNCCVTYDANGGTFGSGSTRTYALVKENSLTPAPGYVDPNTQASVKVPTRMNYQLVGEAKSDGDEDTNDEAILSKSWFLAETDTDGNLVYEGEAQTVKLASTTPWDFTKNKVTKDITLVAQWRETFRFVLCLTEVGEDGKEVEQEVRSYTVDEADTIADKLYKKNDDGELVTRADYIRVSQKGYTFLGFYLDKELTQPLPLDYKHPGRYEQTDPTTSETVMTGDVKIYVKYLKGSYDIISNENVDVLTSSSCWYLTEDIDLSGQEWDAYSDFTGEIIGNGYALKNLTVKSMVTRAMGGQAVSHSIFGSFEGAISDVIFENVTLKVTLRYAVTTDQGEQNATFLAENLGASAKLNNVTLKDCQILFVNADSYQENSEGALWATAETGSTVNNIAIFNDNIPAESVEVELE